MKWENQVDGSSLTLDTGIIYVYRDYVLSKRHGTNLYMFKYNGYRHKKFYKSIASAKRASIKEVKKMLVKTLEKIEKFSDVPESSDFGTYERVSLLG